MDLDKLSTVLAGIRHGANDPRRKRRELSQALRPYSMCMMRCFGTQEGVENFHKSLMEAVFKVIAASSPNADWPESCSEVYFCLSKCSVRSRLVFYTIKARWPGAGAGDAEYLGLIQEHMVAISCNRTLFDNLEGRYVEFEDDPGNPEFREIIGYCEKMAVEWQSK